MTSIEKIDYEIFKPFLDSLDLISASSEWADFVGRHFGGEPHYFGVFENGRMDFIIPAFKVGEELLGVPKLYTEPINYGGNKQGMPLDDVLNFFKTARDFKAVKFSFCPILNPDFSAFVEKEGLNAKRYAHVLKLVAMDENEILTEMVGKKTRNQILASYKRGRFEIKIGQDVAEFYPPYLKSIKRLGSIPKEKGFFDDLKESFGRNFQVLFAYQGNHLAGANLLLIKNKYLHLPFNISSREFFKHYVNDFLYWETVKFGIKHGIETFDFGPSSIKDKSHCHFKEGFGAKPVPIYDFVKYNSPARQFSDFVSRKTRNFRLKVKKYLT